VQRTLPLHLRGKVVDGGCELVLLQLGLLVAHDDSRLHRQSLAKLALGGGGGGSVASQCILDCSEAVAVPHEVSKNTMQGGLEEKER